MTEVFGAGGSGSSGHVIVDEGGVAYPERSNLKFVNASITDDETNDTTIVEVEGTGGIVLDSPTNISLTNNDEAVFLKWTDPDDIIVDGATLASWGGTKIVRKVGAPPTKATDGVLVLDSKTRNQYSVNGFEDTGLTNGVTYYYGFFPYTTAMGYTYTETRQFTPAPIYPTAINDAAATKGYQSAVVAFTKPADATGVRIVYGTTEPANETDGTYIDGVTSPYTISNLTNDTKYYIKAFAYNAKNRYIASNTVEVTPSPVRIKVTAVNDEFIGQTVTVSGPSTQTLTFDSTKELIFEFPQTGTYTVTDGYIGSVNTVVASDYQLYETQVSLARIKVTMNESDIIGKVKARLWSVHTEDGELVYSTVATKTFDSTSVTFYVGYGDYRVGILPTNNSNGVISSSGSNSGNEQVHLANTISVSDSIEYNVPVTFAKLNISFSNLLLNKPISELEETNYVSNQYALAYRIQYHYLDANGNDCENTCTSDVLTGDGRLTYTFYINTDANLYPGNTNFPLSYVWYGRRKTSEVTATTFLTSQSFPNNVTIPFGATGSYSIVIDSAYMHFIVDSDFVSDGCTIKVTYAYKYKGDDSDIRTSTVYNGQIERHVFGYGVPHDNTNGDYIGSKYEVTIYNSDGTTIEHAVKDISMAVGEINTIKVSKNYGYHHNFSDLNPATCITYLADTKNAAYSEMMTNEGTGTATAGSWGNFLTNVLLNKPAMVKKDGTLDYWLDPTDYTKKLDGTASDYNNLNYSGAGAFAWIQKAYMKEVYAADGNSRDVYFNFGTKPDDTYFPVGFLCADGELEGVWIPMGYMDASGRTLVAGTTPVASKTCAQEKNIIDSIGSRARFYGGAITNFMRDLMYMLYKHTDIQLRGGHGRCNAGSQQVISNANVTNGNVVGFKGTNDKKTMNKGFHSQLLFSYQQYCRDPYTLLVNGALKYSDNYEYDISGGTYKTAGDTTWGSLNGGWHYGSHLIKSGDNFGSTPKKENNASTTTGLCDGLYCNTSGVRVALRFSTCADDLSVGPGCLNLNNEASSAVWDRGVGVLLLPPKGYAPAA